MQRVRLHVAANGEIWVISTCKSCGQEARHLAADAILGPIACDSCGHAMDIKGATIEAVEVARESQVAGRVADRRLIDRRPPAARLLISSTVRVFTLDAPFAHPDPDALSGRAR